MQSAANLLLATFGLMLLQQSWRYMPKRFSSVFPSVAFMSSKSRTRHPAQESFGRLAPLGIRPHIQRQAPTCESHIACAGIYVKVRTGT
jgi:hypothetical protein